MGDRRLVMSPSLARCARVARWLRHFASAPNRAQPFRPQHQGVPMSIASIVGRAGRFLGIFDISVGCPLAISADARANAQDAGESVCGPITTKRLERLARVYFAPNAEGAFSPAQASRCQRSIRPGSLGFKARASGSDCFRESRSLRRRLRAARCSWIWSTRSCAIVRPQGTHRQGARRTAAYPRPKGVARIPGLDED